MMPILLVVWVAVEILRCLEIRRLVEAVCKERTPKPAATPPKARGSFVVKRMEQRLKEAMYPNE